MDINICLWERLPNVEINKRCLQFRLLLEDPFEQLSGIVKNVDRHRKPALFLIMTDSCLKIIQAKIKVVRRRKSVNNATIFYSFNLEMLSQQLKVSELWYGLELTYVSPLC